MTLDSFLESVSVDAEAPDDIGDELRALWLAKKDKWHESHDIVEALHSPTAYWIHALLHTIEGDLGNARYWYSKANQPAIDTSEIDNEWERIVQSVIEAQA